jgi:hypothetical protein
VKRRRDAPTEYVFWNGRLLDAPRAARRPRGAEALWIKDGRIEAVGPAAAIRRRAGRTAEPVDLAGGTLTPGFTDAHIHLVTWIRAMDEPWLDAQTPEAIARAAAARLRSAPDEEWVLLRGWVPREWRPERRLRATLDRIAAGRPLVLYAVDGHSVWANGEALSRAGIGDDTPDPPGGVIERDREGKATGALIEAADRPLRAAVRHGEAPSVTLARALARARSLGITSAHDFDRSATWRAAQELDAAGRLGFRLLLSIPVASIDAAIALGLRSGSGSETLRFGPVKMFADGTLGSATALLEAPYAGGAGAPAAASTGIEVTSRDEMAAVCTRAFHAGLSVAIHAIGDRAVRNALDAIAAPLGSGGRYVLPPRVEHVQLARDEDFARFRDLGVLASVQPIHQVTDREVARHHWGERTARSYAYQRLLSNGARLLFGSDAPFDRPGPLLALSSALLRRAPGESPDRTFHPEQRVRLAPALRAHLESPHVAAGWRTPLGRLAPQFGADLAVFDHDLMELEPARWSEVRARAVWVAGKPEPIGN